MDRLHRVKEVFRKEITSRDELKAKDIQVPKTAEAIQATPCPQPCCEEPASPDTQGRRQESSEPPLASPTECNQVFRVQEQTSSPVSSPGPKEYVDSKGRRQVTWTDKGMKRVRKVMEICTWTMMISSLAVERDPEHWKVCRPITIETGFNLLKKSGRKKADKHLEKEKPDLIVAEWMCSPFSSTQNMNLGKGGDIRDRILREQSKHKKVNR